MTEAIVAAAKAAIAHVIGSASIGVMFPVLLSQRSEKVATQQESVASKVLVAVVIQAITATAAVIIGTLITTSVISTKIEQLEQEDRRISTEVNGHLRGGHPWTSIERVNALEKRVDRIEKQKDGH